MGRSTFEFNWPRISRGCLLAAIFMVCWLLLPVAKCSWDAWNATPISSEDPAASAPGQTDRGRLDEGEGFFSKVGHAVKECYAKTPLLEQEAWKTNLLYAFAGIAVLAYVIGKIQRGRGKSYTP